jgi:AraC family transcriptional regulator
MAWRGRERYRLKHREISVDDENYLILNEGSTYGSVLKAPRPAWTFSVFMRPGIQREVHAARGLALEPALEQSTRQAEGGEFSEHLRRHDALVSPKLRHICDAVLDGERSEDWLEEQMLMLLDDRLARATPSTRAELARRLRLAADYIETDYAEPIGLDGMATVACLSRFHFVRFFSALYGVSPHGFLVQRRAAAARRLMQAGETDPETIAVQTGFGSRSSLRRALASTRPG